ncbi:MAG: hypothetical protein GX833_04875 [Clostridium sp.]|jgi:regulator of sigma D|nr:hypothetical protein [Clostridium sp.]
MWKKPRSCQPQDMIYPDRCMLKWQGMLLSDHNERMRQDEILELCETTVRYHSEAEYEVWDRLIQKSKQESLPITLEILRPNEPKLQVTGIIESFKKSTLTLLTPEGPMVISRHQVDDVSQ